MIKNMLSFYFLIITYVNKRHFWINSVNWVIFFLEKYLIKIYSEAWRVKNSRLILSVRTYQIKIQHKVWNFWIMWGHFINLSTVDRLKMSESFSAMLKNRLRKFVCVYIYTQIFMVDFCKYIYIYLFIPTIFLRRLFSILEKLSDVFNLSLSLSLYIYIYIYVEINNENLCEYIYIYIYIL